MSWNKLPSTAIVLLLSSVAMFALAGEKSLLIERWSPERVEPREYTTAMVVGITEDSATRKHFENKMVSHLRGRGIECTTSYSIVPDLTAPGDSSTIVDKLLDRRVDAIITVSLVPEKDAPEHGFADRWSADARGELKPRGYVESSLAGTGTGAKRFVVEVGLWEMGVSRSRIWAARTDSHKIKKLRKLSGRIIQDTIDGLELDRIF